MNNRILLDMEKNETHLILCPECNAELKYNRYVGFENGDAYHEYKCTACDYTGRIFRENIFRKGD